MPRTNWKGIAANSTYYRYDEFLKRTNEVFCQRCKRTERLASYHEARESKYRDKKGKLRTYWVCNPAKRREAIKAWEKEKSDKKAYEELRKEMYARLGRTPD